jgi:hypothetical protein
MAERVVNSWRTPEKLYMKCALVALHDEGLRGNALYEAFATMVPNWRKFFDKPISDAAPVQRADKARRGGKYKMEAPENHPVMKVMFPRAVKDAARRKRWTNKALRLAFAKKPTTARARASKTTQAEARA